MSLPLFDGAAYPSTPTTPPGAPIGYVTPQQPQPPRGSALFSDAEIRARRLQFIELVVREVVKSITGFFVPGAGSATDQLRQWAGNLQDQIGDWPGIGDLVEVLTGKEDGDLNDLGTYVNNMRSFLANIDFNDPSFNPLDAARQFITLMVRPFLNLLFSWVRPQWLPQVSLYSIGDNQPNLLAEPDGSPPPARGARTGGTARRDRWRITPACAGSTKSPNSQGMSAWDHPRLRGEHVNICLAAASAVGSPPPARGARCSRRRRTPGSEDHPRLRGEHRGEHSYRTAPEGSPPPARGAH